MICQLCKGKRDGCAFCRETGEQPTSADLRMGGPFIVYRLADRRPYVVHA
jgi:hypothetical protein